MVKLGRRLENLESMTLESRVDRLIAASDVVLRYYDADPNYRALMDQVIAILDDWNDEPPPGWQSSGLEEAASLRLFANQPDLVEGGRRLLWRWDRACIDSEHGKVFSAFVSATKDILSKEFL